MPGPKLIGHADAGDPACWRPVGLFVRIVQEHGSHLFDAGVPLLIAGARALEITVDAESRARAVVYRTAEGATREVMEARKAALEAVIRG